MKTKENTEIAETQPNANAPSGLDNTSCSTLHLVLTHHWYDATKNKMKRVEYRSMSAHWTRQIWDKREKIGHVRFARGYTKITQTFKVNKIDIGTCPIEGWDGYFYRIHFS